MKAPLRIIKRDNPLSSNYRLLLQLGLILSLGLIILLVKIEIKAPEEAMILSIEMQEEIYMEEVIQTKQELKAPTPPRPVLPAEVPNDEVIEDEIIEIDAEIDFGEVYDIPPPPKPKNDAEEKDEIEEEIFVIVEQPPVLIGGIATIQNEIEYPEMAMKAGIEGKVIVQFVIDKKGNITNPVIVRGIGAGCDEEAIRALKTAKFRPGMQRGRPVQVRYTLPVTFKLKHG